MEYIVTIARQSGTCGREIGLKLSALAGLPFYDNNLIKLAAEKSGMSEEVLEDYDEKASNSLLYALVTGGSSFGHSFAGHNMTLNDKLFVAQADILKGIAEEGKGAVIVGRCADYVLSGYEKLIKVFVMAGFEKRVETVMEREGLNKGEARDFIVKTDKKRSGYYNYYTGEKWGRPDNYDLVINSGDIGSGGAAAVILEYMKQRQQQYTGEE